METSPSIRDQNQGDPIPRADQNASSEQNSSSDQNTSPDQNPSPAQDESWDLPPPPPAVYASRDIAKNRLNEFATQHGYSISFKSTSRNGRISYIGCHRSGNRTSKSQGIRSKTTQQTDCRFQARRTKRYDDQLQFTVDNPSHNHPATAESTLVANRRFQIRMFQRLIKRLFAGHTNQQILGIIRSRTRNGEYHLSVRDIQNFRTSERTRDLAERLYAESRVPLNEILPNPITPLVRPPICSSGTDTI
ncbi:uncharacterized protein N7483_011249 [Penicillium malachiteum]|uniref:uncharacterized protein n=1 Tax=Penicillium malachiteum TaxID=1324776 RepID=UPI002549AB14|nr:uncharacterized protein N7483_011249 [Penicillium malachiteum]KAJ5714068.1 hypothetical protein N7483_011249 [Penicillium malachiteum]